MLKKCLIIIALICFAAHLQAALCEPCAITPVIGSPFTTNISNPTSAAYSPDGHCLTVVNANLNNIPGTISTFIVNPATCAITPANPPMTTGDIMPMLVAFSPNGTCVAVANFGIPNDINNPGSVSMFTIDPVTCLLTPAGAPVPTGGLNPTGLVFSASGDCLIVSNEFSNNLSIFTVDQATCTITQLGAPVPTIGGLSPTLLTFSPTGTCLAVATIDITNINGPGAIDTYSFNPATCALTPLASVNSGGIFPLSVAFPPSGRCLAVANSDLLNMAGTGNLAFFNVDPATCALTLTGAPISSGGTKPFSLAYSLDGSCLVVANLTSNNVSIFTNSLATCVPTLLGTPMAVGNFPRYVTYSPDGTCLAVANAGFNPADGNIAPSSLSIFQTNFVPAPIISATPACSVVTIAGTAQAGSTVTIFQDAIAIGSTIADETGNFVFTTGQLANGIYTFSAQAANAAGCVSVLSNTITVTVCCIPAPVISATTNCSLATITGNALAGSTITIVQNGIPIATIPTDIDGNFAFTTGSLINGTYVFTAQAISPIGCTSDPSNAATVTINCPVSITLPQCSVVRTSRPTITGTALANSVVSIFANNILLGTTESASSGTFAFTPIVPLADNTYTFVATINQAGTTISSNPITIIIDTRGQSRLSQAIGAKYCPTCTA